MGSTLYFNRVQFGTGRPVPYKVLFVGSALCLDWVQFGTGGPVPYEILFVGLKPASTVDGRIISWG